MYLVIQSDSSVHISTGNLFDSKISSYIIDDELNWTKEYEIFNFIWKMCICNVVIICMFIYSMIIIK